MHVDEATHNPVQLTAAPTAARVSTRAADTPEAAARQFVRDRADLWQLNDQDLATVDVVSVTTRGLPTVRMVQKIDGVEVFQSDMTAAVGADNHVVSVSGQLFHGAAASPQRAAARAATARREGNAELKDEEAIAKAAFDLTGYQYKPTDFKAARKRARRDEGPYRFYDCKWKSTTAAAKPAKAKTTAKKSRAKRKKSRAKSKTRTTTRQSKPTPPRFERPVRVKDVLFPMGEGEFIPGYYIELWNRRISSLQLCGR